MKTYLAIFTLISFISCEHPPAPLLGGVQSYDSIESVYNDFNLKNRDVDTAENSGLKEGDKRPPFNVFTIEFAHVDLGYQGRLRMSFFNGRLAASNFYPIDFNAYLSNLKEKRGINLINREDVSKDGARMWKYTDHKGRKYVGSEDKVLENEMRSWIRKYS